MFYRVEPGGPFVVETPYGQITVRGTCFRVEVMQMKVSRQTWIGGAAIYKILPRIAVAWSDVWLGAISASILLLVGKRLLGLYFGLSTVTSAFGAAGALVVILIWVYYAAQIFLLGAEFTKVYADDHGSRAARKAVTRTAATAALGIPTEAEYVAAYCRRTGRDGVPGYDFYIAFNLFRLAAIMHGIRGRVVRGTAASAHARQMAQNVELYARLGWLQAERAMRGGA